MAKDKSAAISEIKSYVSEHGGDYSDWYVGIASKPKDRLFSDHNVSEEKGSWIWMRCTSSDVARAVEKHFLALGMQGGSGGGDDDSDFVYAYKVTSATKE